MIEENISIVRKNIDAINRIGWKNLDKKTQWHRACKSMIAIKMAVDQDGRIVLSRDIN